MVKQSYIQDTAPMEHARYEKKEFIYTGSMKCQWTKKDGWVVVSQTGTYLEEPKLDLLSLYLRKHRMGKYRQPFLCC